MFYHSFKCFLSILLVSSIASCAAIPNELSLAPRQGGCLSAMARPAPVNNIGRVSFQRVIDDPWENSPSTWHPSNLVDVHISAETNIVSTNLITIEITNRSRRANAIILTNYQDTRPTTRVRQEIRVPVPAQTSDGNLIRPGSSTNCVHLPRLDGTWYFQLEN